jgi:hypothetical protein
MSRLTSRIDVLKCRRRRPEYYTALKVLTTEDLGRALFRDLSTLIANLTL